MPPEKFQKMWEFRPPTDRGLDAYLQNLEVTAEWFENKRVLDVGAGMSSFAEDLKSSGINAEVTSIDPFYATTRVERKDLEDEFRATYDQQYEELPARTDTGSNRLVAGAGENLPFRDKSFDIIVALFSLPYYSISDAAKKKFFDEAWRVLAEGGEMRLFPIWGFYQRKEVDMSKISSDLKYLQELGFKTQARTGGPLVCYKD